MISFCRANSLRPPAIEISCSTVIGDVSGYAPGLPTMPVMNTLRLLMCLTTTLTLGVLDELVELRLQLVAELIGRQALTPSRR